MRLGLAYSIRVSGENADGGLFEQNCTTVDLTVNGLRVEGLMQTFRRDAVISVSYGAKSVLVRVMWAGEIGAKLQGHAGLQVIGGWKNLWRRAIPHIPGDGFSKAIAISKNRAEPEPKPRHSDDSGTILFAKGATDAAIRQVAKPEQERFVSFLPRVGVLQRMPREPRLKLQLPVRVCGMSKAGLPFIESIITANISRNGAYLTGLIHEVRKDEVLILSHQDRKGRFRVIWSRKHHIRPVFEIGLRALDLTQSIWTIDFSGVIMDECGPVERRVAQRHICSGGISICHPGTKRSVRAIVADLSMSGCYVETMMPLGVHDRVVLTLNINGTEVRSAAEVRTSHPGLGMGLKFKDMPEADRSGLRALVSKLGYSGSGPMTFVLNVNPEKKAEIAS